MSDARGDRMDAAALADGLAAVFAAELAEQAHAAATAWLQASVPATRVEACRALARTFHTIKGGAGLAGRASLAESAATLERFFADPSPAAAPPQAVVDAVFGAAALPAPALAPLLAALAEDDDAPVAAAGTSLVPCAVGSYSFAVPLAAVTRATLVESAAAPFAGLEMETLWLHDLLALPRPSGRAAALSLRDGVALAVDRVRPPQSLLVDALAPDGIRPAWVVGVAVDGAGIAWRVLDPHRLPRASAAPPPPAASVLVVDDSLVARQAAATALRAARVSFDLARDGHEALAKLRLGAYAVVLSDLEMPHLDGFGLLEQLRASRSLADQPVVVCSSRLDSETRDRLAPLRVAAFLPKPFAPGELLDALRPWLAGIGAPPL